MLLAFFRVHREEFLTAGCLKNEKLSASAAIIGTAACTLVLEHSDATQDEISFQRVGRNIESFHELVVINGRLPEK